MCVAQVGNEKTEGTGLVFLAEEGETEMAITKVDYRDVLAALGAMMAEAGDEGVVAEPYVTLDGYTLSEDFQLETVRLGRGYSLEICGLTLCYDEIGHTWNLDPNEIAGGADALKDLDEYLCDHVVRDDGWEYESSELMMDDLVEFVNETLFACEFYTDDESVNVYVKDWSADEDFFEDKTLITSDRAIDLIAANPSYWLDETYL